jgi:hypothetical protein
MVSSQGFAWLRNSKTDEVALTIKGATSQTANLQNWIDSSDTVLASVGADGNISVPDEAYGSGWNGSLEVPTKNAVYDQVELKAPLASPTFTGIATTPRVIVTTSASPASNGTGTAGEITWDANYVYVCIATNTWARAALTGGY